MGCYSDRVPENEQTTSLGYAAIVDVETTGFSHSNDEVVELGLLLFSFDRATGAPVEIVAEYNGLRDPGRPIPPDATKQHGARFELRVMASHGGTIAIDDSPGGGATFVVELPDDMST